MNTTIENPEAKSNANQASIKKNDCFNVLKENDKNEKVVHIKTETYFDLMCNVKSLLALCENAIYEIAEDNNAFCSGFDVLNVLDIVQQMLPVSEMEILDQISEQKISHS